MLAVSSTGRKYVPALIAGSLIVASAVGSVGVRIVSWASAVPPSKIIALAPATVPVTVITSLAALPRVTFPFSVVLPLTVRSSATTTLPSAISRAVVVAVPVIVSFSSEASHVKLSPALPE